MQHKLWHAIILDLAYVGSKSKDLLRQAQINARAARRHVPAAEPGPDAARRARRRARRRCPTDLLRPYQGYGDIRMWDYSGYSNYHALQTVDQPPVRQRVHVLGLLRVEQGARHRQRRLQPRASRTRATRRPARVDYSYADYDRPHNFVVNFVYQTPKVASGVLGVLANDWQISGIYRWTSGRPYAISFSIPGIGDREPHRAPTATRTRASWSRATRARAGAAIPTGRSTPRASPRRSPAATAPSRPASSCTAPPINNLDLSLSKIFPVGKRRKLEVRLDAFNALNHTQFTGVNSTVNFASLTDPTITNLPYDASGNLVRNNGFGSINGVAPPRTLQLVTRLTF